MMTAGFQAALLLAVLAPSAALGQAKAMADFKARDCPNVMMAADAIGVPVTAATAAAAAPGLTVGKQVRVTLATAAVRYAVTPGHAPAAGTRGGVLALAVDRPGRYRIELGAGVWIDVVRGTAAAASVAHGHGDPCSPFRKWVDFDLAPGRYLVQLSGSATPALWVAVLRRG